MKKLVSSVLVALTMLLVLGSCGSTKNVAYFQNADSISLAASRMLYEAKIMPKDELTITVITTDPKAAMPFNLSVFPLRPQGCVHIQEEGRSGYGRDDSRPDRLRRRR